MKEFKAGLLFMLPLVIFTFFDIYFSIPEKKVMIYSKIRYEGVVESKQNRWGKLTVTLIDKGKRMEILFPDTEEFHRFYNSMQKGDLIRKEETIAVENITSNEKARAIYPIGTTDYTEDLEKYGYKD